MKTFFVRVRVSTRKEAESLKCELLEVDSTRAVTIIEDSDDENDMSCGAQTHQD